MLNISFLRSMEETQSALTSDLQAYERAETPMQSTEMRQLSDDENAAVAGGPEMQVGDGT